MPTPHSMVLNAQEFWQFSLCHYAQAGVQPACLALQNVYRGNINLALLLHWLDTQHIAVTDSELNRLIAGLASSEARLQQFRAMRKQLKPQLEQAGYQQLLTFELALEKEQQHDLIKQLNQFSRCTLPSDDTTASGNLARYCEQLNASILLSQLQAQP